MNRMTGLAWILLVTTLSAGFLTWRLVAGQTKMAPAHVVVIDRSASTRSPCDAVAGLLDDIVRKGALTSRSTVFVLATGDKNTRNEPVLLGTLTGLKSHRAMEGKAAAARRRAEMIAEVENACRALPPTNSSPIFLGLRRGLELLRTSGCATSRGGCTLVARTDGEETAEPGVRRLLESRRPPVESGTRPRLDNQGISVDLCGVADVATGSGKTRTVHTARTADRIFAVWATSFTQQDLVHIAPTCVPRSTTGNRSA